MFVHPILRAAFCFVAAFLPLALNSQTTSLHFKDGIQIISAPVIFTPDASSTYQGRSYAIIQFITTPTSTQRAVYEQDGVRFLSFIPDHAFYVSMPEGLEITHVSTSVPVLNVLPLQPQHKISPSLDEVLPQDQSETLRIRILFTRDVNQNDIEDILVKAGIESAEIPLPDFQAADIDADAMQIAALSNHPTVIWLDLPPEPDTELRYVAVKNERVDALYEDEINLHGEGVTIGVGDAGKVGDHIDLNSHVFNYSPFSVHFHSTHVSGIIAGRPNLNPAEGHGIAQKANLVTNFFSQIITEAERFITDHQMVITNNSYGSSQGSCTLSGDYNVSSIFIDEQLNEHDTLMHVFSAGNDGGLTCAPYPQRYHTIINGWQSAKNTLVVGMLDHLDVVNNSSSRGPCDDGRLKPEIIAVGTNRRSTEPNNVYAGGSGTSYSGPAIAGICALLYEGYRDEHGVSPDASLIKALLLNTADDLGLAGPDFTHGYGRVNTKRAYDAMIAETWYADDADQDEEIDFMLNVPANTAQLRVMLLWKDPAAAPYAAPALVNDLDLEVIDPSEGLYRPWVINPSPAGCNQAATRAIDDKNPQEQVTITTPAAGMYTLRVRGADVPFGPQEFYLAYEIVQHELLVVYPNGNESLVTGETEYIRWDAYGSAVQTYAVEYSLNNGADWTVINNSVGASLRRQSLVIPNNVTDQFRVRVTAGAYQDVSDTASLILRAPTGYALTSPCMNYAQMSWTAVSGAHHYAIYQLIDGWMQQIDTTSATTYLIGGLDPAVREWYSVATVHTSNKQSRRATAKSILATGGLQCTWMNDAGITTIDEPVNGRMHTSTALSASETISITVHNAGTNELNNVPVSYQVNNGTIQNAIIPGPLAAGSLSSYSFVMMSDLSASGTYTIRSWVALAGDMHHDNDTIVHIIRHVQNNPVTLPWNESFESADEVVITTNQFAVPGIERCDFSFNSGTGRLRTKAGEMFIADGDRALTLDAVAYNTTSTDTADITVNLALYDTALHDVRLSFDYMHHVFVPESDSMNRVWVRGSDNDTWIELLDLRDVPAMRGVQTGIAGGLEITEALKEHGQDFSSSFQLRFTEQGDASADHTIMEDGYTVDDLHLFTVANDVRIVSLDHPQSLSCGLGNEFLQVTVENTSGSALPNVEVAFQVNNAPAFIEQIATIPAESTIVHTFTKSHDFSEDTTYTVSVWVHYLSDTYSQNDSLRFVAIHNSESIAAFPYLEDFEEGNGGWLAQGVNTSLEYGTPSGSVISKAASGTHAWVTNLEGDHNDDEESYLVSPCFDLTALTDPILSFSHIYEMEVDYDFHWVEYSTDGETWTKLGTVDTGFNWYNNSNPQSWEGNNTQWHVASIPLPVDESRLQVRFVFTSDVGVTNEGFGLDDVHIHERNPIYHGSDLIDASFPVNGSDWVYLDSGGKRVLGIHPMGQSLGNTVIDAYQSNPDDTADDQAWLLDRNWTIDPANDPMSAIKVRLFFTEADYDDLVDEANDIGTGCIDCIGLEDVYAFEGWKYTGTNEDNTLMNNTSGISTYFPDSDVQVVPYDSGYYAELTISSLSELWLTGQRIRYVDSTSFKVSASSDDAEEYWLTGSVNPISSILDIAETPDSQIVAVRFRDVEIPRGSYIENAWLQFTSAGDDNDDAFTTIRAEDPYSASSYTTRHFNVTSRTYTTHRQTWDLDPWNEDDAGDAQRSTDLRILLQEVVDHNNWLPGRDVAFILTGNGTRRAWSIDGDADLAPRLVIEYDSVCSRSGILYVDRDATGFATGDSWLNALTDLQHAFDVAMRCPDAREIWVRQGVYKTPYFTSFAISSGIEVYGGFNGTETLRTQRNPVLNVTTLSGDIGIIGSITDNSNHVVHILNGSDTAVVDGFTITAGNAQSAVNKGGGIFSEGNCVLKNLIISNCQAVGGGSAIAHRGAGKVMLISNSVLQNNTGVVMLNELGSVMRVDEGSVVVD